MGGGDHSLGALTLIKVCLKKEGGGRSFVNYNFVSKSKQRFFYSYNLQK